MKAKRNMLIFLILWSSISLIYAESNSGKKEKAKNLVLKGIKAIQRMGKEKAFSLFNDKTSEFVDGEYYIFVVDFTGNTLAHGGNPALVGKNLSPLKDPDGVFFIQELIKMAKEHGRGWVNYKWSNPETKKIENKTSYVETIKDTDYFLGCGIYIK